MGKSKRYAGKVSAKSHLLCSVGFITGGWAGVIGA